MCAIWKRTDASGRRSKDPSQPAGDFRYWTYEYFALGKAPQSPPRSLGLGRLSRWHYGELDALLRFLRGGDEPSGAGRTRARALADYLAGFHPRVDADVFRFDDPLPSSSSTGKASVVTRDARSAGSDAGVAAGTSPPTKAQRQE